MRNFGTALTWTGSVSAVISKRKDEVYSQILRDSRVTKERLRSATKHGEKGDSTDHFYTNFHSSFPDVPQTLPFREMRLENTSFAVRTNTEKSAEIAELMYDVIRKTYCWAKLRLFWNFSYLSQQGIMRLACRDTFTPEIGILIVPVVATESIV